MEYKSLSATGETAVAEDRGKYKEQKLKNSNVNGKANL